MHVFLSWFVINDLLDKTKLDRTGEPVNRVQLRTCSVGGGKSFFTGYLVISRIALSDCYIFSSHVTRSMLLGTALELRGNQTEPGPDHRSIYGLWSLVPGVVVHRPHLSYFTFYSFTVMHLVDFYYLAQLGHYTPDTVSVIGFGGHTCEIGAILFLFALSTTCRKSAEGEG